MDDTRPRSLEHPLPAGMRDLLPEEAASRRALSRSILARFAAFGFRLVTPPAFELADVVERGLGAHALADVLRFIEPESGEVAVLRPDMTPQIARIVATRLRDHPPPYRIAYEGTVVRRRAGRAKKHRQIPQVGVELCGVPDGGADLELLEVAADALRSVGLARFTIDVSDAGIVRELVTGANVTDARAEALTSALAKKDEARLAEAARGLAFERELCALPRLHGGRDALASAVAILAASPAGPAARRLLDLFDAAALRGLGAHLSADAGEVRGFAYYTGTIFSIYADGPGEPIGGGGRYDELLSRFGAPMPAVGLGLDLDALGWALREAGGPLPSRDGVVIVGAHDDARAHELRARGVATVAVSAREQALAYARAWSFALVWDGESVLDLRSDPENPSTTAAVDAVAALRVLEDGSR
ncbi:MAG: ATP phosphoribosyltransferase regulatory subunit [Labilithrix sp.]|nr:ATP phosphoribosyltransferase regulatory subunit [Labilithrix sp.]